MARPKLKRCIKFKPTVTYFKPRGVPMNTLKVVQLTVEETEALRLKEVEGLSQTACAKVMKTSPSTLQRILATARKKVANALVKGHAISIINK